MCRAGGNYLPRMRFVWCVCRSRFVLMGHRTMQSCGVPFHTVHHDTGHLHNCARSR